MSFWSRRRRTGPIADYRSGAIGALLVLQGAASPAAAAEYYFQPQVDVSAEVDSNRDLNISGPTPSAGGYGVSAGALMGVATPTSETNVLPRLSYVDYPKLSEHTTEEIVDLSSYWLWLRSQFSVWSEVDHSDLYSSELASATFNPLNPNLPTTPETGRISVTGTRTLATVEPKYQFNVTQRFNLGVSGLYQSVDYAGPDIPQYTSYRYYDGGIDAGWALSPRATLTLGFDASEETAKNVDSVTDGRALSLTYDYQWSKTFTSTLTVMDEHDKIYGVNPADPMLLLNGIGTNGVGAKYSTTWKGEISQLQLAVGSTFTPSGVGGKFRTDQMQVEYKRDLRPRLALLTAGHYIKNVALASEFAGGNYNYVVLNAGLRYSVTRTWYIDAGLQYLDIQYPAAGTSVKNSTASISFGYKGLERQH
jgi:opacity protein-like surface antigen